MPDYDTDDPEILRKQRDRYRASLSVALQECGELERQVKMLVIEIQNLKDERR